MGLPRWRARLHILVVASCVQGSQGMNGVPHGEDDPFLARGRMKWAAPMAWWCNLEDATKIPPRRSTRARLSKSHQKMAAANSALTISEGPNKDGRAERAQRAMHARFRQIKTRGRERRTALLILLAVFKRVKFVVKQLRDSPHFHSE